VMKSSDAGDCIAAERAGEWAEAIDTLLASAPAPAVTPQCECDSSKGILCDDHNPIMQQAEKTIFPQPAQPVEARAKVVGASPVCLDCNKAGMRNCAHFDECDGQWVYKPDGTALQAAEQAAMERAILPTPDISMIKDVEWKKGYRGAWAEYQNSIRALTSSTAAAQREPMKVSPQPAVESDGEAT
jgi:hypothetical protein